jgi:hypothetical protein
MSGVLRVNELYEAKNVSSEDLKRIQELYQIIKLIEKGNFPTKISHILRCPEGFAKYYKQILESEKGKNFRDFILLVGEALEGNEVDIRILQNNPYWRVLEKLAVADETGVALRKLERCVRNTSGYAESIEVILKRLQLLGLIQAHGMGKYKKITEKGKEICRKIAYDENLEEFKETLSLLERNYNCKELTMEEKIKNNIYANILRALGKYKRVTLGKQREIA